MQTKYIFKDDNSNPLVSYSSNLNFIPEPASPRIEEAMSQFSKSISHEVYDKYNYQPRASNLTKEQQNLSCEMMNHITLMIISSDKNLG